MRRIRESGTTGRQDCLHEAQEEGRQVKRAEFTRDWFAYGQTEALRLQIERRTGQRVTQWETNCGDIWVLENRLAA